MIVESIMVSVTAITVASLWFTDRLLKRERANEPKRMSLRARAEKTKILQKGINFCSDNETMTFGETRELYRTRRQKLEDELLKLSEVEDLDP